MRTLVLGRSPFADVVIAEASVAPHHAELTVTDDGRLYLVDCAAAAGTWRQVNRGKGNERWLPLRQDFVAEDEPLRLGDYRCTAGSLLRAARDAPARPGGPVAAMAAADASPGDGGRQPLRGRVERDATTGEIVRRRP